MRLRPPRFTVRRMMVAVAVLGVASWAFARYQRWTVYDSGWWEAECDLWLGQAKIYGCAGLMRGDICRIDEETGLLVDRPGCVSYPGYDQRMKGYNDRIAQYIQRHGLPGNTFKPWEKELSNLALLRCPVADPGAESANRRRAGVSLPRQDERHAPGPRSGRDRLAEGGHHRRRYRGKRLEHPHRRWRLRSAVGTEEFSVCRRSVDHRRRRTLRGL